MKQHEMSKGMSEVMEQVLEEVNEETTVDTTPETSRHGEIFNVLRQVNVNDHTEDKNGLTYLTWSWAWDVFKQHYPSATYNIYKNENGLPFVYDESTGYMVYTSVTVEGLTHEMWLPVMDGANAAMKNAPYTYKVKNKNFKWAKLDKESGKYLDKYGKEQPEYLEKVCEAATMFDINKTIMRCLVKNLAMFGLGLYIYAREDLPDIDKYGGNKKVGDGPGDLISEAKFDTLMAILKPNQIEWVKQTANVSTLDELTNKQYDDLIMALGDKKDGTESKA